MNSKYKILKYNSNNITEVKDLVSVEEPLEILIKYKVKNKLDGKYNFYYDENPRR